MNVITKKKSLTDNLENFLLKNSKQNNDIIKIARCILARKKTFQILIVSYSSIISIIL